MSQSESMKKYEELIAQCDLLIKAGQLSAVASLISDLNWAQVPRAARQSLAKICRRAGLITQGLRLLQPLIRRERRQKDLEPTEGEICEYAVLLSRNGSIQEALGLLEKIRPEETPEALLYLGYCHISNWDYNLAAGYLEKFLNSNADDYSKLIAKVNLAASYIAISKFVQADQLLGEIIETAQASGSSRLVGNCFQLRGQMHFRNDQFSKSRMDLSSAQKIFGDGQSYDQLLIRKWQTIMTAIEEKSAGPLLQFREEALRRKHWESVREADLFAVKVEFDQQRLDYLVCGTPMPAYRDRIQHEVGASASESYMLGSRSQFYLDLKTGEIPGQTALNPGRKIHQVLAALVRDFYVPRNMGTLFSELYPEDYFDINSSPLRVRQLLRRTRRWLEDSSIPALIQQSKGSYRFVIEGSFGIQIPLSSSTIDPNWLRWQEVQTQFAHQTSISAEEACSKLQWSRSSFLRWSEWALGKGLLQKSGANRTTRYHFLFHSKPKSAA